MSETCVRCGKPLPPPKGRGRPRKYCLRCAAKGPAARSWRATNPERVEHYNRDRRVPPSSGLCTECGSTFLGRPNRLVCSYRCRLNRKGRQHWARVRGTAA